MTPNGRSVSLNVRSVTFSAFGRSAGGTSPQINVFTADSLSIIGLNFRVVVPGVGALAIDAGRVVLDPTGVVFIAGRHDIVGHDAPALCGYLAGD